MFRFFKDFIIYGISSLLGKIAAILLMPLYTSILTKEEYGAMALITSVQGVIGLVSNLNIHSGIARDYFEKGIDRKRLVSTGFLSILSLSLTIMVIGLLTRHFWGGQILGLKDCFIPAFTVMLVNIPAGSLMSFFSILTRFKKMPIQYSVGTILQLIIQISISVVGVVVLRAGIISVFLGILGGELFVLFYFAILNREYLGLQFEKKLIKRALIFALPTLPAILAGWLDNSIGQILISKYVSVEDLGVYSIALSLSSVFLIINTAFQNVWSPFLYENHCKIGFSQSMRRLFSIMSIILVAVSLLFSLFSKEIILLLSNESYLDACKYFTLLCIPMSFYLLYPFASSGVIISRDTKYIGIAYVIGSVANLLLLFFTIGSLGVIAVPLCLAASRITAYFILYRVSEKKLSYRLPNYILVLIIFVAFLGLVVIKHQLPLLARICVALILGSLISLYFSKQYNLKETLISLGLLKIKRKY